MLQSIEHLLNLQWEYNTSALVSPVVPRVCDACKEKEENDNEIVDNLCKNDFGKSYS